MRHQPLHSIHGQDVLQQRLGLRLDNRNKPSSVSRDSLRLHDKCKLFEGQPMRRIGGERNCRVQHPTLPPLYRDSLCERCFL